MQMLPHQVSRGRDRHSFLCLRQKVLDYGLADNLENQKRLGVMLSEPSVTGSNGNGDGANGDGGMDWPFGILFRVLVFRYSHHCQVTGLSAGKYGS